MTARTLPSAAGPWHVSMHGVDIVVNVHERKWRGEPDGFFAWVGGEGEPFDVEHERFAWLAPVAPVGSVPPEVYARDVEEAMAAGYTDGDNYTTHNRQRQREAMLATLTAHGLSETEAAAIVTKVSS